MKFLVRATIPIVILAGGFLAWQWLASPIEQPKPLLQAPQRLKTQKSVLHPTSYEIVIGTQGIIRAQQETTITPLVPGTVLQIHPTFEDGAYFKQGEVLLELDPSDLKTAVFAAESRVARAEAAHIQEQARSKQAKIN